MDPKERQRDPGLPCRTPGAAGLSGPPQWLHMKSCVPQLDGNKTRNEMRLPALQLPSGTQQHHYDELQNKHSCLWEPGNGKQRAQLGLGV